MSAKLVFIGLWLLCSGFLLAEGNVFEFFDGMFNPQLDHGPSFSSSKFHPVQVGLNHVTGHIAAFGDFDSDRFNDIFVVSEDKHRIDIYLWDHESYKFNKKEEAYITEHNKTITNVAGADFNYDGKLDLLVSGHNNDVNNTYFLHIYFGNYETFGSMLDVGTAADEVLVMDANGDLLPDLFGTPAQSTKPSFWINRDKATSFEIVPVSSTHGDEWRLASPLSSAFVDLNGDCLSDLLITTTNSNTPGQTFVEIWINDGEAGKFVPDKDPFPLVPGAGQATIADFDGDGTMDILFPVCDPLPTCKDKNWIYIAYNKQLPLCASPWGVNCRHSTDLCVADVNYMHNISFHPSTLSNDVGIVKEDAFGAWRLYVHPDFPLSVRTGDYNLDGYPDLLVPMIHEDGTVMMAMWENVKCAEGRPNCGSTHRTFSPVWHLDTMDALTSISNPYAAAFFDFDENGSPDIFVLIDDTSHKGTKHIKAIFNNFQLDAFFLKTLGLNGVCASWCETDPKFPHPKPYGVNQAGGVFKFTMTDMGGEKHVRAGGQLYQSSYLSLQTPYIIFGLGRTSNYVDDFAYAVPLHHGRHYNYWICIIPNSQLVAIPYHPNLPETWQLELYINPSTVTLWVIIAVVTSLVLLALIIFALEWREKKQDEMLKKENERIFSFSPL